jgi:hypothetical protein
VAWEEFEDYYKFIGGCYEPDALFCTMMTRIWDLDKAPNAAIDARKHMARPPAGMPAKSRAGLHHWQDNTLPMHHIHNTVHTNVDLDQVLFRARSKFAKQGLRACVECVGAFYAADDDVDDLLDVYEFRRACKEVGLGFREVEEAAIFEACGAGGPNTEGAKLPLITFLKMLHGEMPPARLAVVEQAFMSIGGDPASEESTLSPAVLKDSINVEAHPLVTKGQMAPQVLLNEFLDTFSLLAHARGGCNNGMVAFSDFLAYYEVVSSTIDNDAFFNLCVRRLWSLGGGGGGGDAWQPTERPASPRGAKDSPRSPRRESPMAEPRPPVHNGPSSYATAEVPEHQHHRRFVRKEAPMPSPYGEPLGASPPVAPLSGHSPITKSSVIFDEMDASSELGKTIAAFRMSLAKRGLRSWKMLAEKFLDFDHRRNGGIMRLDFDRLNKTMGLGLSPDEREALFKQLSRNRKDGAMDYRACLRNLKGNLPEGRAAAVEDLFGALYQHASGSISKESLKGFFRPQSTPACLLGKKAPGEAFQEFCDAVDYFLVGNDLDLDAFIDFFLMISAIYPEEDEFHMMATAAFGLPH